MALEAKARRCVPLLRRVVDLVNASSKSNILEMIINSFQIKALQKSMVASGTTDDKIRFEPTQTSKLFIRARLGLKKILRSV